MKIKMDVRERLEKLLQGDEIKIYVLKSVIEELKSVGEKAKSALDFAQKFCECVDDSDFRGGTPGERLRTMLGTSAEHVKPRTLFYLHAYQTWLTYLYCDFYLIKSR
jgi:rRNA-processing protein FCF1